MSSATFRLCQTREDYRKLWDELAAKENRMPGIVRAGWNVLNALATFVRSPGLVTRDHYAARLEICDPCNRRTGRRCSVCGCGIDIKARGEAFRCTLGFWDQVDKEHEDAD